MKLPSIKSLESKVWLECKRIIRANYSHVCVTCNKPVEGKQLHTGHFFRKKFIPLQMKYDLRLLRPQCGFCNLRRHGSLEWYTVYLLRNHPKYYILKIARDIEKYKASNEEHPLTTEDKRYILLKLLKKYVTM